VDELEDELLEEEDEDELELLEEEDEEVDELLELLDEELDETEVGVGVTPLIEYTQSEGSEFGSPDG